MNAAILCVGKLKEQYWRDAAAEYIKRLSRYGKLEMIELMDLPERDRMSPAEEKKIRDAEGEAILKKLRPDDVVIALMIEGKQQDSETLAKTLQGYYDTGRRVVFIIGGSLGLSQAVASRAQLQLSFSRLTFPHQLARVMLLEQLYRCCKIQAGERYHK